MYSLIIYGHLELVDEHLSQVVVEFNAEGFDIIQRGLQDLLETACGRNTISIPDAALPLPKVRNNFTGVDG